MIETLLEEHGIQGIEYFDPINTNNSKRKLQQALKSWSNLGLVWFGKEREIHVIYVTIQMIHVKKRESIN